MATKKQKAKKHKVAPEGEAVAVVEKAEKAAARAAEAANARDKAKEAAKKARAAQKAASEAAHAADRATEAAEKEAAKAKEEAEKSEEAAKKVAEGGGKAADRAGVAKAALPAVEAEKAAVAAAKQTATAVAAAEEAVQVAAKSVRNKLKNFRKEIKKNKPKPSGVKIMNPSDQSDWQMIKDGRMTKKVKDNFREYQKLPNNIITLEEVGPCGRNDYALGNKWHKLLSDSIKENQIVERVAVLMFEELRKQFGIELFDSNFLLYGYMYSNEESSPQVYFWQGDADAIGWYYNEKRKNCEYVIVDWEVLRDVQNFWKSPEAFGKHLHQCLVYARLLQLHLSLEYLPSILIVPISSDNGQDIHPGLFWDYPEECKRAIKGFSWSIEQPKPPRNVYRNPPFNSNKMPEEGNIDEEMLLTDVFAVGAKVKDLLNAFDLNGLKVVREPQEH